MFNGQKINVIMPVYNEERTVYKMIGRVLNQQIVDKLIIIYEPSTDRTLKEIKRVIKYSKKTILLINQKQSGKGYSVRRGLATIKQGIIIIQDADEEYSPEDYKELLKKFDENTPVFGERRYISGHRYRGSVYINYIHTFLFNIFYSQKVKDINSCYKIFSINMVKNNKFKENGWKFDMELAITLAKNGYKIKNVPIHYKARTYAEGKKIGSTAAIMFIFYIIKKTI